MEKIMETPEKIKSDKLQHLEHCFELLMKKDDGNNTIQIEKLGKIIWNVICEMKDLGTEEALEYFESNITPKVKEALLQFKIII